jgi:hypothetical protein
MTDTSTPAPEVEVPSEIKTALPPEIQSKLDAIRADIAAEDAAKAQAVQAEEERLARMNAAKKVCFDSCGPISEAILQATNPRERAALIELEAQTHAPHRDLLEKAHREGNGQRDGESNPATPGEVTNIESRIAVLGDSSGDAQES